jgi:hypothetical protein
MSETTITALTDRVSSFEENYMCNVTGFEVTDSEIRIYIDMRSPGTDLILPPNGSLLFHSESKVSLPFVREEYSFQDPMTGYKGFLAYDRKAVVSGTYLFQFSSWDAYSSTPVFTFDGNSFSS